MAWVVLTFSIIVLYSNRSKGYGVVLMIVISCGAGPPIRTIARFFIFCVVHVTQDYIALGNFQSIYNAVILDILNKTEQVEEQCCLLKAIIKTPSA